MLQFILVINNFPSTSQQIEQACLASARIVGQSVGRIATLSHCQRTQAKSTRLALMTGILRGIAKQLADCTTSVGKFLQSFHYRAFSIYLRKQSQ